MTQLPTAQSRTIEAPDMPAESPFDLEFFLVEVSGFRGMAYRDTEGKWRDAQTTEELPPNVCVLE